MRRPWRGQYVPVESDRDPVDDQAHQMMRLLEAVRKSGALDQSVRAEAPMSKDVIVKRIRRARADGADLIRQTSASVSGSASRLPWPLSSIVRRATSVAGQIASRIDPRPVGSETALYLASSLRRLSSQPRRSALRETAAKYATDLAEVLPDGSEIKTEAEEIASVLAEESIQSDSYTIEAIGLDSMASKLRPGSPSRASIEREAAKIRLKSHQVVFWRGAWTDIGEVSSQLASEAEFWASYATDLMTP